jgi:hypothetical protein
MRNEDCPNPVVKETHLRAYPGWRVRQYRNGWFDATDDYGLTLGVRSFTEAVAEVRNAVKEQREWELAEAEAERQAEEGWLRAAEYDEENQEQLRRDDELYGPAIPDDLEAQWQALYDTGWPNDN